jgi:orotate phosphoribosyltransferase-like protein
MGKRRVWTTPDDRRMRSMAAAGYTWDEIADEFGVTKDSATAHAYRSRITAGTVGVGKIDPTARSVTIDLIRRGLSIPEIAAARGVARETVREMVLRLEEGGLIRRVGRRKGQIGEKGWSAIRFQVTRRWYAND